MSYNRLWARGLRLVSHGVAEIMPTFSFYLGLFVVAKPNTLSVNAIHAQLLTNNVSYSLLIPQRFSLPIVQSFIQLFPCTFEGGVDVT